MSIQDELAIIQQKMNEAKAFYEVRSQINGIYTNIARLEEMISGYQADGMFDSIPTEIKQAYNRLYQILLQAKSDIAADAAFESIVNY